MVIQARTTPKAFSAPDPRRLAIESKMSPRKKPITPLNTNALKSTIPKPAPVTQPQGLTQPQGQTSMQGFTNSQYKANPNYNIFDAKTQNVYSDTWSRGADGMIEFAGGNRVDGTNLSEEQANEMSSFFSGASNKRNLFHEQYSDSIKENDRIVKENVKWDDWNGMDNEKKLELFKRLYGNSPVNEYGDLLSGDLLYGRGNGGFLSGINVKMQGGKGEQFIDPRDTASMYKNLNQGYGFKEMNFAPRSTALKDRLQGLIPPLPGSVTTPAPSTGGTASPTSPTSPVNTPPQSTQMSETLLKYLQSMWKGGF